jgi:uncharacterized membrane protein YqjE
MPASASPLSFLGPAPRIVLEGLMHRSQLATLEMTEARDHAARTALIGLLAGVGALLAGFAALLTLAALVWHRDDRGLILGLATLVIVIGAGALGAWAAHRLRTWQPLAETRRQLREDRICLENLLPEDQGS